MPIELGPTGDLVRIRGIDKERRRIYIELLNGQTGTINDDAPPDWEQGTVLFIVRDGDRSSAEKVSADVWPEEAWVGVIRLRQSEDTVVDTSGRLRLIPTSSVDYRVGNTVVGTDRAGVLRILSQEPIRYLDLPDIDDTVVDRFKSTDSKTTFDDFGGLAHVVARARELIEVPLRHHEKFGATGARPIKGVLFTGPPGTGKTMLARIVATESGAAFYEVSGPEIFSKWYGESEKILRAIFARAAEDTRAIIFFDEIDSIAGQRSGEAHEASKRVVAQLLTLMDTNDNIVVIAATNRPQDVDVALRRPGRFDWEITFPLPDRQEREAILTVTAKRHTTSEDLPHGIVAERTPSWSGAELSAIWTEAALLAVADGRDRIMAEDYMGGYQRVAVQRRRIRKAEAEGGS